MQVREIPDDETVLHVPGTSYFHALDDSRQVPLKAMCCGCRKAYQKKPASEVLSKRLKPCLQCFRAG